MSQIAKGGDAYTLISGEEFKKHTTGFRFNKEEKFIFKEESKKIFFEPKNISFSLNEFIEILVKNHLSDKTFWKRKKDCMVYCYLKCLFWLSDKHYERVQVMLDLYHTDKKSEHDKNDEKNIEPFFKYFYITKNILFISLFVTFPLSIFVVYFTNIPNFSLSNPSIFLLFFLILFTIEKFSMWLDKKIKDFFKKDKNFIFNLHNFQFQHHFKLKF